MLLRVKCSNEPEIEPSNSFFHFSKIMEAKKSGDLLILVFYPSANVSKGISGNEKRITFRFSIKIFSFALKQKISSLFFGITKEVLSEDEIGKDLETTTQNFIENSIDFFHLMGNFFFFKEKNEPLRSINVCVKFFFSTFPNRI